MSSVPRAERGQGRFAPGRVLTLAWAAATALLLGLGVWQLQRLAWKTELIDRAREAAAAPARDLPVGVLDVSALDRVRLSVTGVYLERPAVALGLVTRDGRPGSRLLAPFRLADGRTLLVDRGFVPEPFLREALAAKPPAGPRTLEGIARAGGEGGWLVPARDRDLPRWYAPDLAAIGDYLGLELEPLLLVLEQPEPGIGPYPIPAPLPVDLPNPHLGYALTWFGLAGALLVFYILLARRPVVEERL